MPLTLTKERYRPGDPVVFEKLLWLLESELDDGPEYTMDFYRVIYEVSLGTINPDERYPHRIWYDVEYDVGLGTFERGQHFTGTFSKSKGANTSKVMRDPMGVVCGRLNLDDKYEVYDYLRQVARSLDIDSEYKVAQCLRYKEAGW